MRWIYVKDRLPELGIENILPEYGTYSRSEKLMLATKHGGIYIGYYELYKSIDGTRTRTWSHAWESGDDDIDTDGSEIFEVIAWAKMPKPPLTEYIC